MKSASESLHCFLTAMGARKRGKKYLLDEFDGEFYLIFDASEDPETPEAKGTCDILIAKVGSHPSDSCDQTRVLANCRRHQVMRFMFALGVQRFSEKTRAFLYTANSVIRMDGGA